MSLRGDIYDVAAYIEKCQTEGSQPDMDYVQAFDRIVSHLNAYAQDNIELRKDLTAIYKKAKPWAQN